MNNIQILNDISIAIGSIAAFILSKKWVVPLLIKCWHWLKHEKKEYDDNNIDSSKELTNIKNSNVKVYESQINFLVNQLQTLELQLDNYSVQLEKLREKILELNTSLFNKSMTIGKLREMSCCKSDCQFREMCNENDVIKEEEKDEVK